jgi:hypothetical protein
MRSVAVLRSIAVAWLTCQFAALCVAALAMCCPGAAPGDLCPMHRLKQAEPKCLMRAACEPTDAALVALSTGAGVLPHFSISFASLQSLEPVHAIALSTLARADRPDAPPPKA